MLAENVHPFEKGVQGSHFVVGSRSPDQTRKVGYGLLTLFLRPTQHRRSLSGCQTLPLALWYWTKPDNHDLVLNAALDLRRSKSELLLENALLCQQLIVLKRQVKRPALTWRDRVLFVLLARELRSWKQAVLPEKSHPPEQQRPSTTSSFGRLILIG